jgi:large subunit ribosomal protein L21
MYAVIETGGKQYRVELGTELEVELLDVEPGQEINLDRVLLVVDGEKSAVGQPVVADAAVSAKVLRHTRGVKTIAFKYRPKARSRVKKGHRQELTALRIIDVRLGDHSAAADAKVEATEADEERARVSKAAARQAAEDMVLAEKLKARDAAAEPKAAPKARAAAKSATPKAEKEAAPAKSATPKAEKEVAPAKAAAAPRTAKAARTDESAAKAAAKPAARPRTKKDE